MVVIGASPAQAHDHPTPVELDAPGVVQVLTYGQVDISLIEHNAAGSHIGLFQRTYSPLLNSGSGFAVDASGSIVTSPAVIDADLRRAEIYAVNSVFHDRYGDAAPMPSDPFATHSISDFDPQDPVNARLQRCYQSNSTDDTGGCVVFSTRVVKVLPFVTSQEQYGNLAADVVVPAAGEASDVAVLRVGGGSMPTVALGTTNADVAAFSVLGFTQTPTNEKSLSTAIGHFPADGATEVDKDEDYDPLVKALGAGLLGGPVVGERGQVVGFLAGAAGPADLASGLVLVGPDKVRAALTKANVDARRGPTDAVYESAMHNFKNKLYPASIPSFEQVLSYYPGHALAAEKLAIAAQGGVPGESGAPSSPGSATQSSDAASWYDRFLLPILLGFAVLVAVVVLLAVLRRRRGQPREGTPDGNDDDMIVLPNRPPSHRRNSERPAAMPAQAASSRRSQPGEPSSAGRPGQSARNSQLSQGARTGQSPRTSQPSQGPRTGQPSQGPRTGQPSQGPRTGQPSQGPRTGQPSQGPRTGQPSQGPRTGQPSTPPGAPSRPSHPSNPGAAETVFRPLPAFGSPDLARSGSRSAADSAHETMQRGAPALVPDAGPESTICSRCGRPVPLGNTYCGHCAQRQTP
jgi:hypothetical protein